MTLSYRSSTFYRFRCHYPLITYLRQKQMNFRCRSFVQFKVRMKTWQFKMSKPTTVWILKENTFKKRGFRDSRQKQLNFWCRPLIQFKVRMKIWQFEMPKAITVWISKENEIQKRGSLDSRQKPLNFRCQNLLPYEF